MVYRHRPGSIPAEQRKRVDLARNLAARRRSEQEDSFNQLTWLQTWEPSQEEERKKREWNELSERNMPERQ
jgi:hypothetical protein